MASPTSVESLSLTAPFCAGFCPSPGTAGLAASLSDKLKAIHSHCSGTGAQEARSVAGEAGAVEAVCKATALLAMPDDG